MRCGKRLQEGAEIRDGPGVDGGTRGMSGWGRRSGGRQGGRTDRLVSDLLAEDGNQLLNWDTNLKAWWTAATANPCPPTVCRHSPNFRSHLPLFPSALTAPRLLCA
jgi:hypothetical protein